MVELTPHEARKAAQAAGDIFGDVLVSLNALFVKVTREQFDYIRDNDLRIPVFGGIPVYYVIREDD